MNPTLNERVESIWIIIFINCRRNLPIGPTRTIRKRAIAAIATKIAATDGKTTTIHGKNSKWLFCNWIFIMFRNWWQSTDALLPYSLLQIGKSWRWLELSSKIFSHRYNTPMSTISSLKIWNEPLQWHRWLSSDRCHNRRFSECNRNSWTSCLLTVFSQPKNTQCEPILNITYFLNHELKPQPFTGIFMN